MAEIVTVIRALPTSSSIYRVGDVTVKSLADALRSPEWFVCDGRTLDRRLYSDLYDAIGTTYGGTKERFKIPDCRSKLAQPLPGERKSAPRGWWDWESLDE